MHQLAQGCYAIQSPADGKYMSRYTKGGAIDADQVLDVSGGDSSTLILYAVHGGSNQRWHATLN